MQNRLRITTAALALAAVLLTGCRGDRTDAPPRRFFPGMDDQQKWDPQEETAFFEDGRTARPWVDGAVAFGVATFDPEAMAGEPWAREMLRDRADLLAEDDRVYLGTTAGAGPDATFVDRIPVGVTMEMIERGEERFNIYCSACHGYTGVGDGMVGQKWSYTPANLMIDLYQDRSQRQGKDGYLFHVVREGVWDPATGANRMPGYKHAVDVHDAWAIVAYLRVLQTRGGVPLDDLDPTDRERLLRSAPTTAAGPAEPEPIASAGGEQ